MDENLESTRVLVCRAQEGSREAMNALFARYEKPILEAARRALGPRLRRREEPEDLALSVFREAVRDFDRFEYRSERAFRSWLLQILEHKVRDRAEHWRTAKRDSDRERSIEKARDDATEVAIPARDPSVTQLVVIEERGRLIRRAMASLPEKHRRTLEYAYYQRLPLREIMTRLNLPSEDAARMRVRRAEKALRERLPPGIESDW